VAATASDLREKLRTACDALADASVTRIDDADGTYYRDEPLAEHGGLAFLFPGQGSQYTNMLREPTLFFRPLRERFDRADAALEGVRLPAALATFHGRRGGPRARRYARRTTRPRRSRFGNGASDVDVRDPPDCGRRAQLWRLRRTGIRGRSRRVRALRHFGG